MKIPNVIKTLKIIINYIKDELEKEYIKNENNLRKGDESEKNHYNIKLKNLNEVR